mgnify:CR=1 FL=1
MRTQAVAPLIGVVVLAIALTWMNRGLRRRAQASDQDKHEQLLALSAARGWSYQRYGASLALPFAPQQVAPAASGNANSVIQGMEHSWPFLACEYSYTIGSGENLVHRSNLVLAMNLGAAVPRLAIKVAGAGPFGGTLGSPITTGDPHFDEAFTIDADGVDFAHAVLTPGVRAVMLAYPHVEWFFVGSSLVSSQRGSDVGAEIDAMLRSAVAVLNAIPTPVWERLHGDGPRAQA